MKAFRILQTINLQRSVAQAHHHTRLKLHTVTRTSQGITKPQSAPYSSSPLFRLLFKQFRTPPLFRRPPTKQPNSTSPNFNPTPNLGSPEPSLSLSQRLRKLSREYGWSALGVYLLLTAVDLPLCFIAVRWLGTDRIGHWEHMIVERFWGFVELALPNVRRGQGVQSVDEVERVGEPVDGVFPRVDSQSDEVGVQGYDHGVKEAEQRNKADASIWTQLALAYAIHKSFIFIRVPLTAALTPKIVRVLRGWGWDIGKIKPKTTKGTKN